LFSAVCNDGRYLSQAIERHNCVPYGVQPNLSRFFDTTMRNYYVPSQALTMMAKGYLAGEAGESD